MKRHIGVYIFLLGLGLLLSACAGAPAPEEAAPAEEVAPAVEEPAEEPTEEPPAIASPPPTAEAPPAGDEPIPTVTFDVVPENEPTAVPSIEQRRLVLEFPPKIRAGDSDIIRLTLEVDDLGNITPTAEIEGHKVTGETIEVTNLYETHNIIAESRLDMAGMQIVPADIISEPLLPGSKVTFFWSVSAPDAGEYRGTVWFYLRYVPKNGGEELRRAVSAQSIDIKATKFFGILSASPAKKLGAIGSFLGALLGFPFMDDVLKILWKKVRG